MVVVADAGLCNKKRCGPSSYATIRDVDGVNWKRLKTKMKDYWR